MRVLLHTGKGGVGKTSLSLATAFAAARHGHRVFVLSTDAAHSLGDALGRPVGPRPVEVADRVVAQEVGVLDELDRAWSEIQGWLRNLVAAGADDLLAEELLVFPGLEELIALRAVREVEASGEVDVCVVDCAPTGGTLRMLRFPDALRVLMESLFEWERKGARLLRPVLSSMRVGHLVPSEAFFESLERLYHEVEDVRQILVDGDRTTARLVVNPARVVVEETRRSYAYLSLYGVATDAVLVNRVVPRDAGEGWFARWAEREERARAEIATSFPLPCFEAPWLTREPIGAEALGAVGDTLFGGDDPARVLTRRRPIRMLPGSELPTLEIELPNAASEDVSLGLRGVELWVRVRDAERGGSRPQSLAGRSVHSSRFSAGVLEVVFSA